MGVLPAEVRDQEEGVEEPTNSIIDPNLRGESGVSSFVSQDPNSGHNSTLIEKGKEVSKGQR